jgi:hypothetical protein
VYNNSIVYKRLQYSVSIPSTVAHVNIKKSAFYSTLFPLMVIRKKHSSLRLSLPLLSLRFSQRLSLLSRPTRVGGECIFFFGFCWLNRIIWWILVLGFGFQWPLWVYGWVSMAWVSMVAMES